MNSPMFSISSLSINLLNEIKIDLSKKIKTLQKITVKNKVDKFLIDIYSKKISVINNELKKINFCKNIKNNDV